MPIQHARFVHGTCFIDLIWCSDLPQNIQKCKEKTPDAIHIIDKMIHKKVEPMEVYIQVRVKSVVNKKINLIAL